VGRIDLAHAPDPDETDDIIRPDPVAGMECHTTLQSADAAIIAAGTGSYSVE